jgi:hypothetical protein
LIGACATALNSLLTGVLSKTEFMPPRGKINNLLRKLMEGEDVHQINLAFGTGINKDTVRAFSPCITVR